MASFQEGSDIDGQDIVINTQTGGAWYVLNGTPNGLPDDDGRVLALQFTTAGTFSGEMNFQIFENGDGSSDIRKTFFFDGTGTFFADGEGPGGNACGCTDDSATNFDPDATYDDGSCPPVLPGCMRSDASNYRALATIEDGSCLYQGCLDSSAINHDPSATLPGECVGAVTGCLDSLAINFYQGANTPLNESVLFFFVLDFIGQSIILFIICNKKQLVCQFIYFALNFRIHFFRLTIA